MAKDINEDDIRSMFIPVEELGMDPGQFRVDPVYWYNEMYDMYKDSCHFDNSLDPAQSNERHCPEDQLSTKGFSVHGRVGFFWWYALTMYYDESVHNMDEQKRKYNAHHQKTTCDDFSNAGDNLCHAINGVSDLVNVLKRNPIVANTSECVDGWDEEEDCLSLEYSQLEDMAVRLNVFLGQGPISREVFKKDGDNILINTNIIKGKDVVLPFVWANNENLKLFGKLAKRCADSGANTVVGIFASRQVPTMDGREASKIPLESEPNFSPSFGFSF